ACVVFSPRFEWQIQYLELAGEWEVEPIVLRQPIPTISLLKGVDAVVSAGRGTWAYPPTASSGAGSALWTGIWLRSGGWRCSRLRRTSRGSSSPRDERSNRCERTRPPSSTSSGGSP